MSQEISDPKSEKSGRLFAYAIGSFALGVIGHIFQHNMPKDWRGNHDLMDIWSHVGNVTGSILTVSSATMIVAFARGDLFRTAVPIKRTASTAAFGLALGLGMNAAYDAPVLAETAVMQTVFRGGEADPLDLPYGGIATIAEAGLLAWASSKRPSTQPSLNLPPNTDP